MMLRQIRSIACSKPFAVDMMARQRILCFYHWRWHCAGRALVLHQFNSISEEVFPC
jgi:hypothetical protein